MKTRIAILLVLSLLATLGVAAAYRIYTPKEIGEIQTVVSGNFDSCTAPNGDVAPRPVLLPSPFQAGALLFLALAFSGGLLIALRQRQWAWSPAVVVLLVANLGLWGAVGLGAHNLTTSKGNPIAHSHNPETVTPAQKEFMEASDAQLIPGKRTVEAPPSSTYDCHGKTFDAEASWINDDQVEKILNDDGYKPVPAGGARLGDVVVYRNNGQVTHSGIVTGIDSDGNVTEVCSKWGKGFEYRHAPNEVPQGQMGMVNGMKVTRGTYGTPTVYRRS
jgi:hypothetical protein